MMWIRPDRRAYVLGFAITFLICDHPPAAAQDSPASETGNQVPIQAVARISDRFVNHILERSIYHWQVIQEYMFGTRTSGTASMQGTVTAQLIPNTQQAVLDIRLVGTSRCNDNVGQRRSVTIHTSAGAQIDARKRVVIDASGINALPSVANCAAQVQVNDIAAPRRIVERLAWRRANRMHDEIEEAAADSVRTRTQSQLDQEMANVLAESNKVVRETLNSASVNHAEFPCRLLFSGTSRFLQAAIVPARSPERGSAIQPLELNSRYDVAFGIHESCLNRICEFSLGGKELQDVGFLHFMEVLTGNSPRPLWVHDRTDRWSVVVAKQSPLTANFAEDRFTLTFRVVSCLRGEKKLDRPMEIVATYRPEITHDGPHLIRQGELAVHFSDTSATTSSDEGFRQFLQQKFCGVFQPELYFDGIVPPAGGSLSKLRQLELKELRTRDGWAVIAYQLPPDNTQVAHAGN